ncbi:ribonucleoside-diphosphate reductase subunit alpha [archaeon]|nr:ribonucleoside-diphosphate reductase subunit alpha [archaeon]NDB78696.1 ribonucleoside-diphosphate reductase subunit alpha [archaeon]
MKERKPFDWINEESVTFLRRGYLSEGEEPLERIRTIANHAEELLGMDGFADKFFEYMGKGWYSLSSPVWANFGKKRGLPVSCFGSNIGDNIESILYTQAEVGEMSKMGGGTSGYFGNIRGRGAEITDNGHAPGAVHFMNLFESVVDNISQGSTRRGRFSPYLPVEHPDIMEFLEIGTEGFPIQDLTHAVTVTDKFMNEMIEGDEDKRGIWAKVIQRRGEIGYPYIMFTDTMNNKSPEVYRDNGAKIYNSNLCSEIALHNSEEESFVCVLSSMNVLHYDEWKDTDAVEIMTYFLDAVVTEFLTKIENLRDNGTIEGKRAFLYLEKAYNFAKRQRALGLGVLGWHSLLQSKGLPFDTKESAKLNVEVFKLIKEKSYSASSELAEKFGEPEYLRGYGRRNVTLNAIAPTTSSAFILGQVSQSIEPIWSNCYVKDVAKMKVTIKNPILVELLKELDKDNREIWDSIKKNDGSVQHLDFLSDEQKNIFRTFAEINQASIINQAAIRQDYIDQSQSLNLMISPDMPTRDVNKLLIDAWKLGVKTLYYQHSMNSAQAFARKKLNLNDLQCVACEG